MPCSHTACPASHLLHAQATPEAQSCPGSGARQAGHSLLAHYPGADTEADRGDVTRDADPVDLSWATLRVHLVQSRAGRDGNAKGRERKDRARPLAEAAAEWAARPQAGGFPAPRLFPHVCHEEQ